MLAAAIIVIGFAWRPWINNAQALTKEAAEEAVLQLYPGQVTGTKLSKGQYSMQLKTDKGLYEMKVDALSGEIVSLMRIEAPASQDDAAPATPNPTSPVKASPTTEPSKDTTRKPDKPNKDLPKDQTPKQQTPKEPSPTQTPKDDFPEQPSKKDETPKATGSPKEQAPTLLTSADASLLAAKHVKGQVKDTDLRETAAGSYYLVEIRGGKEKKAVVQVNAITGAIMSVTWDDNHRGDDRAGKGRGKDDSGDHGDRNDD